MQCIAQVRAGRMALGGGVLKADARKGMFRVLLGDDTLVHAVWCERNGAEPSGSNEEDIVVFPDECTFKPIPGGQARCYVLDFPTDASRNLFFWLQEPKQEHDELHVSRVNAALNGLPLPPLPTTGPTPAAPATAAPTPAAAATTSAPAAAPPLAGAGGNQASSLAALLSQALSSAGAAQPAAPDPHALAASLLRQMAAQGGAGGGLLGRMAPDQGPGLEEVMRPEVVVPLLRSAPGAMERLAPHLPEEHRSLEQLIATAQSPQFAQQLSTFSAALQSGQLDLRQFGLDAKGYSVAAFLEAVQEAADRDRARKGQENKREQQGGAGDNGGAAPMEQ